jgi:hypothetical protein
MPGNILHGKTSLYTRSDTMLVKSDNVGWGCSWGLSLGAGVPLMMLPQVGAVRWGEERGCESGCSDPARQLNRPATPGGEAGGRGGERGAETTPVRCDPSTPRRGEGWCWAGSHSILPWPPGRGWGRSEGEARERVTAHHECWLATERNSGHKREILVT